MALSASLSMSSMNLWGCPWKLRWLTILKSSSSVTWLLWALMPAMAGQV
jgi:hypothetical protein